MVSLKERHLNSPSCRANWASDEKMETEEGKDDANYVKACARLVKVDPGTSTTERNGGPKDGTR